MRRDKGEIASFEYSYARPIKITESTIEERSKDEKNITHPLMTHNSSLMFHKHLGNEC